MVEEKCQNSKYHKVRPTSEVSNLVEFTGGSYNEKCKLIAYRDDGSDGQIIRVDDKRHGAANEGGLNQQRVSPNCCSGSNEE